MEKLYGFEVRHATEAEIPAIMKITQEAFANYCALAGIDTAKIAATSETEEDVARDIATKEVYVAFIDDVPVGSVRVEILDDNRARLSRFGIRTDHQNHGIGKILMNVVDNSMRQKGIKVLELYTAAKFQLLVRFYYGRGFYIEEVSNDRGYLRAKLIKEY
ncbi:MAG: GNAT family N-acetyltransferase [Oscillospiraceae bacterium]|nr:GNAT family N-acetyltransferase [Oscillospiraceae bacterium]